jgi:nucleoside-diphosphate-sugar epimerase
LRALITGASGFAGRWLCRECAAGGDEVVAVSRRGTVPDGCGRGIRLDLQRRCVRPRRDPGATVAGSGDHARLTALTGWEPTTPLRQTMTDTIAWWERRLAA